MSYQTSIHFDPTALLIIKSEVDNSITQIESAVNALVEDQNIPFGLDDALLHFEQCSRVLALIDMPYLSKITQYASDLIRKIMIKPSEIDEADIMVLSESTNTLRRYIEFICLREIRIPQFLLETINALEIRLHKPITNESFYVEKFVPEQPIACDFPLLESVEKSHFIHKLYKFALSQLLQEPKKTPNQVAFNLIGLQLANLAQNTLTEQYWNFVHYAFQHIDSIIINKPRLRTLIQIEHNIYLFAEDPKNYQVTRGDLANVLALCICHENEFSQNLRHILEIKDTILTDTQLHVLNRQLLSPDHNTMVTVSHLLSEEMTTLRREIEYSYQNLSPEKVAELQAKIKELANILNILNLNEAAHELLQQANALANIAESVSEDFVKDLMNTMLAATNAVDLLERQHTSKRLQLPTNNTNISLDRLDEAHKSLLEESQLAIEAAQIALNQHLENLEDLASLEIAALKLREISGAMRILGVETGYQALSLTAKFIEEKQNLEQGLSPQELLYIFDSLACAEVWIENLKNKQPVLNSMFDVALASSQKLKAVA